MSYTDNERVYKSADGSLFVLTKDTYGLINVKSGVAHFMKTVGHKTESWIETLSKQRIDVLLKKYDEQKEQRIQEMQEMLKQAELVIDEVKQSYEG